MSDTANQNGQQAPEPVPALIVPVTDTPVSNPQAFPSALGKVSRSGDGVHDELINHRVVQVSKVFDLSAKHSRSTDSSSKERHALDNPQQIYALEAEDGTTLFLSRAQLEKRLLSLPSNGFDPLDLSKLRDNAAASRGLGDWIWTKLSVLELVPDSLVMAAKDKALEYLEERLGDAISDTLGDLAAPAASWMGAKALMHVIESKLAGQPGLYQWKTERLRDSDRVDAEFNTPPYQRLVEAAKNNQPILLFIHGTASHTFGSFGDLRSGKDGAWDQLVRGFKDHIYGFEHRTFSQSPLENVLELVKLLPKNTNLSIVTHSRGGLVGDLLCLGNLQDAEIKRYQRKAPLDENGERREESLAERQLRERIIREEQGQLRQLRQLLAEKQFKIQRYVRVACPAAGTSILSENLDVFCSSLLALFNATMSMVGVVGFIGGNILSVVRRVVLEIVQKRIDPQLIPGLEAMLPNSPLVALLAQTARQENIQMAVISGDTDGGSIVKRILSLFADWIIFGNFEHDLVVDTQSMRGGLAQRGSTHECFVQGGEVSHVHYFMRGKTRSALCNWLTHKLPETLTGFTVLSQGQAFLKESAWEATLGRDGISDNRPILFYLPGLMGSHLEIRAENDNRPGEGSRIWFEPAELFVGGIGLLKLDGEKHNIHPEGIFRRYYGDLADHLSSTFQIVPFAYDWRDDLHKAAAELAKQVRDKLDEQPKRPISLLAHSMGGLVARLMIARHPDVWETMVERPGCRFLMLGTPNNGSHMVVEALLGKADSVRTLARFDFRHDMRELLGIIAGFTGMLQLLPRPGFQDTGMEGSQGAFDYFDASAWLTAKAYNRDRWFGNQLCGQPAPDTLQTAVSLWDSLREQSEQGIKHSQHVAYVFGSDTHTPCGLKEADGRWQMLGTQRGDGSVTWDSGSLPGLDNIWYMPVDHGGLACDKRYFPAIADLLLKGKTEQLAQQPSPSRGLRSVYPYEAHPVLQPGNEDLELALFHAKSQRQQSEETVQPLHIGVHAMDLRFVQHPIICGHYLSDSIAGTEAQIDRYLLDGALALRKQLGVYAGEIGSSTLVLKAQGTEERKRGTRHGAIIVGLGEWSRVTTQMITETVRDGVLEYLLYSAEHEINDGTNRQSRQLVLNSLLLGYNSIAHISVTSSLDAVVCGVCEANQQFRRTGLRSGLGIEELRFVELYLDTAITAAHAVRELPLRLEKDLERMDARVVPARELIFHKEKPRHRLSERSVGGYWTRLMVTDNDADTTQAKQKRVRKLINQQQGESADIVVDPPAIAEKLKYVFLSERARAETVEQMRQPGLIEALIREQVTKPAYDPDVCRTLFQLMMPLDFKMTVRQTERLLLVLDAYTANLPWEMLQADDHPLALKMTMVRQLVAVHFRKVVRGNLKHTACVIGNPATTGFFKHYPISGRPLIAEDDGSLVSLTGATEEAHAVTKTLRDAGYEVETLYPYTANAPAEHAAIQVFNKLFKRPYRILMIAAHGVVGMVGKDGLERSGVVLSDGVMLTAAEVGQMEVVPDLVFLNCCHLGEISSTPYASYNRLAYGVSRELIEMGVRCVVAAGWAVDDQAAKSFSTEFFQRFVGEKLSFGKAVFEARKHVYTYYPYSNTWGAYQAYGDPNYVLDNNESEDLASIVAPHELLNRLDDLIIGHRYSVDRQKLSLPAFQEQVSRLLQTVPAEWREMPDVQFKLAGIYAGWGGDGYEVALGAYRKAIQADSYMGQVPIAAFEQLSNLEVRYIASLSQSLYTSLSSLTEDKWKDEDILVMLRQNIRQYPYWLQQIDTAVMRLEMLFPLHQPLGDEDKAAPAQAERHGLIGSAWKRKAQVQVDLAEALLLPLPFKNHHKYLLFYLLRDEDELLKGLRSETGWKKIRHSLEQSSKAYRRGENLSFSGTFNPYPLLNRLQLEGLLGEVQDKSAQEHYALLAEQVKEVARQRFHESYEFFDAVMVADAEVALYLTRTACTDEDVDMLVTAYREAMKKVPNSARELGSVIEQLRFLARLAARSSADIKINLQRSKVLEKVAGVLQNEKT